MCGDNDIMDIRNLTKILYDKEPDLHEYYVDTEKMRFFKCYTPQNKKNFLNEVRVFKALEGKKFIPKLHAIHETNSFNALEMDFIPYPALWGYTNTGMPWERETYSAEQIQSMRTQFQEIVKELKKADGLIVPKTNQFGQEVDAYVTFELGKNNIIYNPENDRLYLIDFAHCHYSLSHTESMVHDVIDRLPCDTPYKTRIDGDNIKHIICPDNKQLYDAGEDLIRDLVAARVGPMYQAVHVNGKFVRGQMAPMFERMEQIKVRHEDFLDKYVVDIGCNIGDLCAWLIRMGASRVTGIEGLGLQYGLAQKYIGYLNDAYSSTGQMTYNNIELVNISAPSYSYTKDIDTIMYFGCFGHFGSAEYHKRMGDAANVIYFGGHGLENELERMKKTLPEFGNYEWELIGQFNEGIDGVGRPRPVFRGVKCPK